MRSRSGRPTPTDDLMSVLVHAEVDGDRLEPDEVLHESLLILVGGDETTRHVISGGMEQLLLHPDQRQLLVDDPAKIPVAVEEMLRWVSPIKNMCRTVTHDTEFLGEQLREGQKCMLLYESANRDESKFADPYRFDVERQPNEHVAFGFGAHFCLGQALARLELRVMFEQLLTRLPDSSSRPSLRIFRAGRRTSSAAWSRCRCASRRWRRSTGPPCERCPCSRTV